MATQTIGGMEKTGIHIIDQLRQTNPERNVALVAIEQLKSKVDIVRFYDGYVVYLKRHGDPSEREDPQTMARQNLLSATGYYDERTRAKWHAAIKEITESEYSQGELLRK